jgi:hypothetical protein
MPIDLSMLDGPTVRPDQPEAKLVAQVKTNPQEDAYDSQVEAQPWVDKALDDAITNASNPHVRQILLEEKANRQAKPKPIDMSMLDQPKPAVDLSMLDQPKPKVDLSMLQPQQTNLQKATGSAMAGIDFLSGVPGMVAGGLAGAGKFLTSGDPAAASQTMDDTSKLFQVSHWLEQAGIPKEYLHNDRAQQALSTALNYAPEHAGSWVQDFAKAHGVSDSTAVALATQVHTLITAAEFGLPTHQLAKGAKLSPMDIRNARDKLGYKPNVDETAAPERGQDVNTGVNLPPDASIDPQTTQGDMLGQPGVQDMPWKTDENGMPYKEDISQVNEPSLFDPPQQGMEPQSPLPGATPDMFPKDDLAGKYRKTAKGEIEKTEQPPQTLPKNWPEARDKYGNIAPQWYVDNIERQGEHKPSVEQPDSVPYYPENPTVTQDAHNATQVDKAWDQFNAEKSAQEQAQFQGEKDMQRMGATPTRGRYSAGNKQRGSVDIPGPLADLGEYIRNKIIRRVGEDNRSRIVHRATFGEGRVQPGEWVSPNRDLAENVYGKGDHRGTPKIITDALPAKDLYEVHPGGWIYAPHGTDISGVVRHVAPDGTKVTMKDVLDKAGKTVGEVPHYDGRPRAMQEQAAASTRKPSMSNRQRGVIDPEVFLGKFPEFAASKVKDGFGKLKQVFHGTSKDKDFKKFNTGLRGAWFTESPSDASAYAKDNDSKDVKWDWKTNTYNTKNNADRVHPVYLNIKNPYTVTHQDFKYLNSSGNYAQLQRNFFATLKGKGYDGVYFPEHDGGIYRHSENAESHAVWVAFNQDQIKSALSFDKDQPKTLGSPTKGSQSGAIDFGALFGKKPNTGVSAGDQVNGLSKDNVKDIIARALTTSETLEAFKSKLDLFSDDAAWQNGIVAHAQDMWLDKTGFMDSYGKSVFSQLSPTDKKMTADLRSWPIFANEENPKQLPAKADVHIASRFTSPTSVIRRISNPQARQFLNWAISNAQEIANSGQRLYQRLVETQEKASKLSRKEQLGMYKTVLKFDGTQNTQLRDLGLQWPTADMLRKDGLSDYQIEAYQELTKGLDNSYSMIEQVSHDNGLIPPERIPGWFPHTWLGSYRVLISDKDGLHTMRAYDTKYGQMWGERAARKEFPDHIVKTEDPSPSINDKTVVDAMMQAIGVFKKSDALGQAIMTKLGRMDQWQTRGIIKEALERQGVKGFDAESGIKNDIPFLGGRAHNDRILAAYQRYMEHVSQFYVNSRVAKEVKAPLTDNADLLEHTPQLQRYLNDFVSNVTGHAINHDILPSEVLRQIAIHLGLPPNIGINALTGLGKYMIMVRLRVPNPRFMMANGIQSLTQMGDIFQVHTERMIAQEKGENVQVGSPVKAMSTMLSAWSKVMNDGNWEPWARGAVQYAKDRDIISVFMSDHVDPIKQTDTIGKTMSTILDKPNNGIEKHNRLATYLAHVAYNLDAKMPPREAYEAAANQVDLAMGNYNQMHQPQMYRNLGIGGQLLRPFALLRNVYLGKGALAMQTLLDGFKTSPKAAAYGSVNMAQYLGAWVIFAGTSGMIGANEYDALAKAYNSFVKPDNMLPRAGELARKWGMPNWLIYGLVSSWSENAPNIGPSLAAPAMNEATGIPAIDAGKHMLGLGLEAGKAAFSDTGANQTEMYEHGRALAPNMAQPWIEKMIADKQGGVTPQATKFDNGYRRTPTDFAVVASTGARTQRETEARDIHGLSKYMEATDKDWKSTQVSKIVDGLLGIGPDNSREVIIKALEANKGFDADSLKLAIKKEMDRRFTDFSTEEIKDLMNANTPAERAYKAQRYNELHRIGK